MQASLTWRGQVRYDMLGVGVFFFFFQAEDGIRDLTVTGVQTCALPISRCSPKPDPIVSTLAMNGSRPGEMTSRIRTTVPRCTVLPFAATVPFSTLEIGRASCRERV